MKKKKKIIHHSFYVPNLSLKSDFIYHPSISREWHLKIYQLDLKQTIKPKQIK